MGAGLSILMHQHVDDLLQVAPPPPHLQTCLSELVQR